MDEVEAAVRQWAETRWNDFRDRYSDNSQSLYMYLRILHWKFPHRHDLYLKALKQHSRMDALATYDSVITDILNKRL